MARVFQDGFEMGVPAYTTAGRTEAPYGSLWFVAHTNSCGTGVSAVTKNSGNYGMRVYHPSSNYHAYAKRDLGASLKEHFGRIELYANSSAGTSPFLSLYDDSLRRIAYLARLIDGSIAIYVGSTLVGSIVAILPLQLFTRIEWHIIVDSVDGLVEIKVNGNSTFTYNGNTQGANSENVRYVVLRQIAWVDGANRGDFYYDDIAINDTTGAVNNSWCGKGSIFLLKPKGIGNYSQFAPSNESLDNYEIVDEIPADGDTTYVQSDTAEEIDTYDMEEIVADLGIDPDGVVKAVQTVFTGRYEGADAHLAPVLRLGAVDHEGDKQEMTGTYYALSHQVFNVSPFSGVAWTLTELDAIEAGVKHKEHTYG